MVKGKINMLSLIMIMIIVLLLGIGIGYVVFSNVSEVVKSANAKQDGFIEREHKYNTQGTIGETILEENVSLYNDATSSVINNISETNSNVTETPKYDGSKSITINGKEYIVSYKNELNNRDEAEEDWAYYDVTLYFNNVKLKTYKHKGIFDDMLNHMDLVELDSILGGYNNMEEFIIIILNNGHVGGNVKDFCIINTDGEIMGLFDWDTFTGIRELSTNEHLTYEINKDNIILYKTTYSTHGVECEIGKTNFNYAVLKYKITVDENYMKKEVLKGYTSQEVELTGK